MKKRALLSSGFAVA